MSHQGLVKRGSMSHELWFRTRISNEHRRKNFQRLNTSNIEIKFEITASHNTVKYILYLSFTTLLLLMSIF